MKNLLASTAFANPAAAVKTPETAGKAGAPKAEDRIAPVFTAVRSDIAIPTGSKRGSKSELGEKLAALDVNQSIGLTNKTKKQISSSISKINNNADNQRQKIGADGAPVFGEGEPIKDAAGNVVGRGTPVKVMEMVKEFQAFDVDPKTDPDKATVRIFRIK